LAVDFSCDNADKAIEKLSLQYHKARQAQITKEIVEIADHPLGDILVENIGLINKRTSTIIPRAIYIKKFLSY